MRLINWLFFFFNATCVSIFSQMELLNSDDWLKKSVYINHMTISRTTDSRHILSSTTSLSDSRLALSQMDRDLKKTDGNRKRGQKEPWLCKASYWNFSIKRGINRHDLTHRVAISAARFMRLACAANQV